MSSDTELTALAPGSELVRVAFTSARDSGQAVLFTFPVPVNKLAVRVADLDLARFKERQEELLWVLSVPLSGDDAGVLRRAREWADAGGFAGATSQVVTLQGAHIIWAPGRVAVVAEPHRLDAVRGALIEVCYYEAELHSLEHEMGLLWPELDADGGLAFEFNEKSVHGRRKLAERFRKVLALRARLARITPHVLMPHVYPPTLASQVGERLRERARMAHRVDSVDGQLEVFERVYEACGQRASDFVLARTGHTLEWIIVVLLLAQTILVTVELLSRR